MRLTREELLAELVKLNAVPWAEEDEFTLYDYGEAMQSQGVTLTESGIRGQLTKVVKEGKLTTRYPVRVQGRKAPCRVWRIVSPVVPPCGDKCGASAGIGSGGGDK